MVLVQLLLPLYDNEGKMFPSHFFTALKTELTENFGGITTYTRSPASGLWKEDDDKVVYDDIIIYEVMAEELDLDWWKAFKLRLEVHFKQDEIVVRSWPITKL